MTDEDRQERSGDPAETSARADRRSASSCSVAERLFAERGYRNVTVRDIADAAGVTHPLIYYYWGSKGSLLAAVTRAQPGSRPGRGPRTMRSALWRRSCASLWPRTASTC